MSTTKQFRLHRTPRYRAKNDPEGVTRTIAPDPDACFKTVEAKNRDDLLNQVREFGAEFGKACDVFMKCLAGRSFNRTPLYVQCNYDNMPEPPAEFQ